MASAMGSWWAQLAPEMYCVILDTMSGVSCTARGGQAGSAGRYAQAPPHLSFPGCPAPRARSLAEGLCPPHIPRAHPQGPAPFSPTPGVP